MDEFTKEVVITALRDMFQSRNFNICTIDKCLKLAGSIPDGHEYDSLSALHCISWKDMSPELRKEVFDRTRGFFAGRGFDLSALEMIFNKDSQVFELESKKKRRFLGII